MTPDGTTACDIVTHPAYTALRRAAKVRGLATQTGAAMLTAQMPLDLEFLRL